MRRHVLLLVVSLGCGRPSSPPPPTTNVPSDAARDAPLDQDLPRLAERSVKLYQDVVAAFAAAGEDCAVATIKLGELAKLHGDVVAANAKVEHEGRGAALKAALKPYDDVLSTAAKTIMHSPTLARCAQDPSFGAAWESLVGAP